MIRDLNTLAETTRGAALNNTPALRWSRHQLRVIRWHRLLQLLAPLLGLLVALVLAAPTFAQEDDPGTYQTDIPIELPAYHGLEPSLRLAYDSTGGNGWLGVGWKLAGLSYIERKSPGRGLPAYDDRDVFFLDGKELISCVEGMQSPSCASESLPSNYKAYTTKIESFKRIAFDTAGRRWYVWSKTGVKSTFVPQLTTSAGVFNWTLASVEDPSGNTVTYTYWVDATFGAKYLDAITYNGVEVKFYSERRSDPISMSTGKSFWTMFHRLKTIDIRVGSQRSRAYTLRYTTRPTSTNRSLLAEVQQYGTDAVVDPYGSITGGTALPAQKFTPQPGGEAGKWQPQPPASIAWGPAQWPDGGPSSFDTPFNTTIALPTTSSSVRMRTSGDFDGDGRADWMHISYTKSTGVFQFSSALAESNGTYRMSQKSATAPASLAAYERPQVWPADLNGDGKTDLLFGFYERRPDPANPAAEYYYLRLLPALMSNDSTFELSASEISTDWAEWQRPGEVQPLRCALGDVNGNGRTALICSFLRGTNRDRLMLGTFYRSFDGTYVKPETAINHPAGGRLLAGDFNGDGKTDLLHGSVLTSLGHGAYTLDTTRNPGAIDTGTFVADLNGDGRSDLLHLDQSSEFYPKFTAITTLLNEPNGNFVRRTQNLPTPIEDGEANFQLGDVNGDGKTDLVVAHRWSGASPCGTGLTYARPFVTRALGQGDGTFALPANWWSCGAGKDIPLPWVQHMEEPPAPINYWEPDFGLEDLDGDGSANFRGVYRRATAGGWAATIVGLVSPRSGADTARWMPADVNGDGRQDLLYVYPMHAGLRIHTLLRHPNQSLAQHTQDVLPNLPHPIARNWKVADLNGDGKADLVAVVATAGTASPQVYTLLSQGDGTWNAPPPATWQGFVGRDVLNWLPIDLNGDGKTDLAHISVSTQDSRLTIDTLHAGENNTWEAGKYEQTVTGWALDALSNLQLWKPLDFNGDGLQDLVHMVDGNGEIILHSLRRTGDDPSTPQVREDTFAPLVSASWSSPQFLDMLSWQVGDVNGDGAADLVHVSYYADQGVRAQTLFSQGDGTAWRASDAPIISAPEGTQPWMSAVRDWRLVDVNSDGRADLVQFARQRLDDPDSVTTFVSRGDGSWTRTSSWAAPFFDRAGGWMAADADGDGRPDLVRTDLRPNGLVVTVLVPQAARDLLEVVENGMGGRTTISYRPSSAWQTTNPTAECALPNGQVLTTVGSVTTSDGRGTESTVQYSYACPRWSAPERRFLTWRTVTENHLAAANRPEFRLQSSYNAHPQGIVELVETARLDMAGRVFDKTTYAYEELATVAPYRSLETSRREQHCNLTTTCAINDTEYKYDKFGNLTRTTAYAGANGGSLARETTHTYTSNTAQYIVGLEASKKISVRDGATLGQAQLTLYCYDGDNSGCGQAPTRGLITAIKAWNSQTGGYATTTMEYDQWGNPTTVIDANGNPTFTKYDSLYHLYPTQITNALGHPVTQEWDYALSKLKKTTGANGEITTWEYDPLGRLVKQTDPNGGVLRRSYLDLGDPNRQHMHEWREDGSADGLWSEQYLDGLGRTYRVVREGRDASDTFAQETEYRDASNRAFRQSHWFEQGQPAVYEQFEYDGAERLLTQTHPDGITRQWQYGNDSLMAWAKALDERGNGRTEFRDAFGRIARVREHPASKVMIDTNYTYDILDHLTQVTDSAGNVTTVAWDALGRKRHQSDPDMGTWSYTYDAVGNVLTQTDARGIVTTFEYDTINRMIGKNNGTLTSWRYDEPGHGAGIGRLTSVIDSSGAGCPDGVSESLSYSGAGQITSQRKCVVGQTQQLSFGYDNLGRQQTMTYPDGEVLRYEYDAAGRLKSVPGYVNDLSYEADGRLRAASYANGTQTTLTYDPQREWLTAASVMRGNSTLYDARYTAYYPNGLIKSMASSTDQLNLGFSYDNLDRLTAVSGDVNQTFQYDALGNMTHNSAVGAYTYPASGPNGCGSGTPCAGVHAVQQAGSLSYSYDANGNMTKVFNIAMGAEQQRLAWNADNQLAEVWRGSSRVLRAVYDVAGERALKEEAGETSRYFGPLLEHSSTAGLIKYYYAGPLLVAQRSTGGVVWHHQDHLGSTRLLTDQNGKVVQRYQYAPFGHILGATGTHDNDITYTGHRSDMSTGLIYMRARYYDPALARFTSADTIVPRPYDPQSLNRYSYVSNNPISRVDLDGHKDDKPDTGQPNPQGSTTDDTGQKSDQQESSQNSSQDEGEGKEKGKRKGLRLSDDVGIGAQLNVSTFGCFGPCTWALDITVGAYESPTGVMWFVSLGGAFMGVTPGPDGLKPALGAGLGAGVAAQGSISEARNASEFSEWSQTISGGALFGSGSYSRSLSEPRPVTLAGGPSAGPGAGVASYNTYTWTTNLPQKIRDWVRSW